MRIIKTWTIREAEYLRKNYPTTSIHDLAKTLNRSADCIREYANRVLKVKKPVRINQWTKEEDQIILDNLSTNMTDVANRLPDRTLAAIYVRKCSLKRRVVHG